jgi:hypothetical protein
LSQQPADTEKETYPGITLEGIQETTPPPHKRADIQKAAKLMIMTLFNQKYLSKKVIGAT